MLKKEYSGQKNLCWPLVFLLCVLFCTSCGSTSKRNSHRYSSWFEENGKLKVLSTTAMIDALVAAVGSDRVDHRALVTGEMDPHSYDLVKGDNEKIYRAKLIVANGLNLEHGAGLCSQLKTHPSCLFLAEAIRDRVPGKILHFGKEIDPHVWMDISLWIEGIIPLVEAFSKLDPAYAEFYKENGEKAREKLLQAHADLQNKMAKIPAHLRYLVTSHDAFRYFARAYLAERGEWEERCMAPEGLAPEGQLSVQDIRRVVDHLCAYQIGVVFSEANVSKDALNKIVSACESRGLKVRISHDPLYGDSMGKLGTSAGEYPGMLEYNGEVLKKGWERE